MNISAPFIQRPIATSLLMVGLLVAGLVSYPLLPVAALPNVDYPTLQISAQLPGADPQTIASSIATPLEEQFGQIPGLTQMTSASALGNTQITLQFDLSRSLDGAVADTLSAINAATAQLPQNLPYPPTIRKVNPADTPILVAAVIVADPAAHHGGCFRGKHSAAKDLANFRGRPGGNRWAAAAGDSRPG